MCLPYLPFLFASVQLIQSSYPSKESRLVDEVLGNTNFLWTIVRKFKKESDIAFTCILQQLLFFIIRSMVMLLYIQFFHAS
jgi:hypothetical protein